MPLQLEMRFEKYGKETAHQIGKIMCHLQHKMKNEVILLNKHYSLKQGLNKFGTKAKNAAQKEMSQLHDRKVFVTMKPQSRTK